MNQYSILIFVLINNITMCLRCHDKYMRIGYIHCEECYKNDSVIYIGDDVYKTFDGKILCAEHRKKI